MADGKGLKLAFAQAEINANKRDNSTNIDLAYMDLQAQKASERGYFIGKRKQRDNIKFAQLISENIEYLNMKSYLTTAEKAFILDLSPYVQVYSHAVVDPKTGQYFTVTELAKNLKRSRQKTSPLIDGLIRKGIMFEFANVLELKIFGRSVTARPFFITPEIMCNGSRDRIEGGIAGLIIHHSVLEKNGVYLPKKLVREPNAKYGKLIDNPKHKRKK